MGLTFYDGAGSPYAWRVFLALEHKQLPYERVTLSFANRDMHTPEFARMNPRKRVPAIRDGEFVLYESAAIVEYVEERHPDAPRLFPTDLEARAIVRRYIHEIDTYVGQPVSTLGKYVFRAADRAGASDQAFIDQAAQSLRDELAFFETAIAGDYLTSTLTAADLSLYPLFAMFARFELRNPTVDISSCIGPRVRAWMTRIEALPYFATTYPAHWR